MSKESEIISRYFSAIGRKGGRKSKRVLDPAVARNMVKVREARRAFKKYYASCFWSYDPELKIQFEDVRWVGEQLMKNGSVACWYIGRRLCQ